MGPEAGQGFVSSKLAADPGVAAAPASSATKAAISAKRFIFLPGVSGTAAK
jgi:hypothetical protein